MRSSRFLEGFLMVIVLELLIMKTIFRVQRYNFFPKLLSIFTRIISKFLIHEKFVFDSREFVLEKVDQGTVL